ncbi:unnamed protein product [Bursaphelenchus okinawaensis]|uniref:START domain-containing protein n=1 Tax=Bursaphelenchus okinawaensis TaxID=465554 RepID=A0A811L8B4_9BILA|nr:unnamed protein product [Bursaphelenchus okinawaensis]CAG9118759.1 unnamed protein product [Bursaphelenchus okinawaensis]
MKWSILFVIFSCAYARPELTDLLQAEPNEILSQFVPSCKALLQNASPLLPQLPPSPFPSKQEYLRLGNKAVQEMKSLVESDVETTWPEVEREDDDYKIYSKKSPFKELKEDLLMLETTAKANISKVATLMAPFRGYRAKWDDLYEFNNVIENLGNETYIIHEAVHSVFVLSARDAVLVCKEEHFGTTLILGCHNTTHVNVPEKEDYVRTVQRLVGYYLTPDEKNPHWTKIHAIIGVDLNLKVGFFSSLVNRFKPGQLVDFVGRLNDAVKNYKF